MYVAIIKKKPCQNAKYNRCGQSLAKIGKTNPTTQKEIVHWRVWVFICFSVCSNF